MQNTLTLLYDWSFWAVIVATISIVLSQIPPIHVIFKRAKLDLDIYQRIYITHKLGNPNLQMHLQIHNIGGRRVKIKSMAVSISRDGNHVINLPAESYLQNQNDQNNLLFTAFTLDPKKNGRIVQIF